MKKIMRRLRDAASTVSMAVLLTFNLFFMVFLLLGIVTLLVYFGVDRGFLVRNGTVTVEGGLVILYAVCILIAVSMVVMIHEIFLKPIHRQIDAMEQLAQGNFSVRVKEKPDKNEFMTRDMRNFAHSFNAAAAELGGTELLRKDFINNFSHEFKTPIVSINGFADLLLEEDLPEEDRREFLTIIRDESKRLADLATNILTLNRIEAQTILTEKERFSLDEQLRQCILVTQQKWKEKNPEFQVELEAVEFTGNSALLKEIWLNLLDNAAKFSPDGGCIAVTLHQEGKACTVTVTDHGEGMDEKTQAHIFEQFYQGDTSHKTQGNGLGLAMASKIAVLHGGEIAVDSRPGSGSSFAVKLPVA